MKALLIIFSLLLISACDKKISAPDGFIELKEREPRASSLGYSFIPPYGEKWYEGFSEKTIMYLKITNPNELSLFAGATEAITDKDIKTKEEFLNYIKLKKSTFSSYPLRYKNTVSSFKLDSTISKSCVSYQEITEDHKAKNLNNNKYLVLKNKGVVCLHPTMQRQLIDIYYSIRTIPNLKAEKYEIEVENFIKSLKMNNA